MGHDETGRGKGTTGRLLGQLDLGLPRRDPTNVTGVTSANLLARSQDYRNHDQAASDRFGDVVWADPQNIECE